MTNPVTKHPREIVTRLLAEAAISDRPGQMNRLEAEAAAVQVLIDEYELALGRVARLAGQIGSYEAILEANGILLPNE